MSQVVIERVTKSFAGSGSGVVQALHEACLTARAGELTALLGPSGCGKTTLLRVVAGLERPDSGTLLIDGRNVLPLPAKDREVAMVFQQPALYPHLTARENLAFGLRLRKIPAQEVRQRVEEAAGLLGVADCLTRHPQELSGGQRQRVALGRAIVRRPGVYLLDEPLSQLDAPMRLQLRRDLRRIQQDLGATMIFVTHDQADAFAIADRVAVMMDGAILQCDRPAGVYNKPASVPVAKFIGNPPMNLLPVVLMRGGGGPILDWSTVDQGDRAAAVVRLILPESSFSAELANYDGKQVILGVRSEHMQMAGNGASEASTTPVRLVRAEFFGADQLLHLSAGPISLIARVPSGASLVPGQEVKLSLRWRDCLFYEPGTGRLLRS